MCLFEKHFPHQGLFKKVRVRVLIFFKNGQKRAKNAKKGKTFENLVKIEQNFKIFCKRACDCVQLLHAINC